MEDDELTIREEPASQSPGRDLLAAVEAELIGMYGADNTDVTPSATPRDLSPPRGCLLVLYRGGSAIGCGAVKPLGDGLAEIKRMYVVPEERSRGHARRVLLALEDAARALGCATVRLDTGAKQPHAVALYSSAGYTPVPDYNENPKASYWFEKDL